MRTLTTLLLAVFCLFSSHAIAQKGSIQKLLEKNGFEWKSGVAKPSDFDKEKGLDGKTEVTKLSFGPGEKKTTTTNVLNSVKSLNFTPLGFKEALQFRDPANELYAGMHKGKTTVFLGSSVRVGKKTYYPTLYWDKETEKGTIVMTDDPFCCEINIVVKR